MAECYNKIYLKEKDIEVECGKCLNCLENKKKEKALRLVHEMNNYQYKTFITLTMDEIRATRCKTGETEVRKQELKNYIKRLKYYDDREIKYIRDPKKRIKMKYIACGEYGTQTQRAHYHIVLLHNTYLHFEIKNQWKKGHVQMEMVKDVRALYYTAGYVDKKQEKYFQNEYIAKKEEKEPQFLIASRGNGLEWIKEAITTKKIDKHNYFVRGVNGKNKLPTYYKGKLKEMVMGVKPRYKKLTEPERELFRKRYGFDRKTIMLNQEEYDKNRWKWELFIKTVIQEAKQRDPLYYRNKDYEILRNKDNWRQKLYNLMYNKKWDEMDEVERNYSGYIQRRRELLKIKAEQKWFKNKAKRDIA